MKKPLLLFVIPFIYISCKKEVPEFGDPTALTSGSWRETVLFNNYFSNNILIKIDTLPVMNNNAVLHTVFKADNTFEAYAEDSSNADGFGGTFYYLKNDQILSQSWPSRISSKGNKNNVANERNITYLSSQAPGSLTYTIDLRKADTLVITAKILIYGNEKDGNYFSQTRKLIRDL